MNSESLLQVLNANPFVLAPMAGITDCAFRSFMKSMGCGIVITELVSANGLEFSSGPTRRLMRFADNQRPVGIQIFGDDPEVLARGAAQVEESGADFVDLNFGCPVPKVVKKGAGSALLRDLVRLAKVLEAVKKAVTIPVTIKIRTGWDESTRNADEVCQIAFDQGMSWVAIHGRTRAQGYSGSADWDYISLVKQKAKLPILGNGDIISSEQAIERLRVSGCNGVMIGRGCLKNPWIFQQSLSLYQSSHSTAKATPRGWDFAGILNRLKTFLELDCDERLLMIQMKKFAAWYSAGFPESNRFRKEIFQAHELSELMDRVGLFFEHCQTLARADTSKEAFLMGGHG